ncbi:MULTISPECIES: LysR substrate-binding domain-containing protein [Pseudomonas]|uniref:LysR substrate-binding domain-containing protein n=1 Tax=Pseudomonas TaxID=286 RepID=UPI001F0211CF|nr:MULTISPECIES: LysR substrate-binding domain-containing protein [Pseudomonas]MDO4236927.1 LysR substrate-binding domain-containing protein [Pseudomonas sp.]WLI05681.1 LysR substrate-binding domain-containing protein [Pseudomonas sp. FP597]WPN21751.1 LysR substrate-binding domain-containing protein [Pseudomonas marginalis]WSO08065.1 LysR substrate-binding domain-containing protein [Pseudomonas lurida]
MELFKIKNCLPMIGPYVNRLDLNDLFIFVNVVDRGGFTAAVASTGMPKSTLSHRMQQLEGELGVRLLSRTSRRFGMTEAGEEFYQHALAALREAEMAEMSVRQRLLEPVGTIRCTAGVATMNFAMAGMIADFLRVYPKINMVAHAADRTIDIVGENYDVAIRAHEAPLPDSDLVQRMLGVAPWFLFAGSSYLAEHGAPATPAELSSHASIFFARANAPMNWRLRHVTLSIEEIAVPIMPRLQSEDMLSLQHAAISGLGIVALPSYIARAAVARGELHRVLPEWIAGDARITALVPSRKGLLPSVRVFLDHLASEFPKIL